VYDGETVIAVVAVLALEENFTTSPSENSQSKDPVSTSGNADSVDMVIGTIYLNIGS